MTELVTPAEAMALLGISRATLARRTHDGTLPSVSIGHRRFYRREDMEDLLSVKEAMALLRISRSTLNRLTWDGTLNSVQIGRRRLYRVADLEALMTSRYADRPTRG